MASSGWKMAGQQAVAVQALNPLAIAFVGLGPALDLAGELGRGGDDVEARFEQGEEQDVAVDAGGLQGDGGDAHRPSARRPDARSPGVWAGNSRTVSEPSGVASTQTQWRAVADVDAGGVAMCAPAATTSLAQASASRRSCSSWRC